MVNHWTNRSIEDYRFKIAADFINQLEEKMESDNINQDKLAELIGLTKGRISQILKNPGNITIGNIVKFARAIGLKVSLVAYDDNDPGNNRGPINSEIFKICWENSGKPHDFWAFENVSQTATKPFVLYMNNMYDGTINLITYSLYGTARSAGTVGVVDIGNAIGVSAANESTVNVKNGEIKIPLQLATGSI